MLTGTATWRSRVAPGRSRPPPADAERSAGRAAGSRGRGRARTLDACSTPAHSNTMSRVGSGTRPTTGLSSHVDWIDPSRTLGDGRILRTAESIADGRRGKLILLADGAARSPPDTRSARSRRDRLEARAGRAARTARRAPAPDATVGLCPASTGHCRRASSARPTSQARAVLAACLPARLREPGRGARDGRRRGRPEQRGRGARGEPNVGDGHRTPRGYCRDGGSASLRAAGTVEPSAAGAPGGHPVHQRRRVLPGAGQRILRRGGARRRAGAGSTLAPRRSARWAPTS